MDQDILNKRIAVAGIGGVGGYLAGMLGRVCPHLTMAVRGDRRESILKNGLVIHSEYKGESNVRTEYAVTVSGMGEQEYIFVWVRK